MVNISQDDEDMMDKRNIRKNEPLLTLSKYRRERTNIYFGVLLYKEDGDELTVGDKFKINHR